MDYDKILQERKVPEKLVKDILRDQDLEIFDVARWTRQDILGVMKDKNIITDDENAFVDKVIHELSAMFDAYVGINWEVIDAAVDTVHSMIES